MPWGAIFSGGASLIGGALQSGAVDGANSENAALQRQARQIAGQNYQNDRGNVAPYISTGQGALTQQNALLGLGGQDAANTAMSSFQASPGYAYQVQQGLRGVDAGAASRGMLRSGATLKAEQTLGSNLANQDFGQYFGRLNSLSGMGLQGAGLDNQATAIYNGVLSGSTNQQAGMNANAAGTQASIYGAQANALGGTVNGAIKNDLFSSLIGGGGSDPFAGAGMSKIGGFA